MSCADSIEAPFAEQSDGDMVRVEIETSGLVVRD